MQCDAVHRKVEVDRGKRVGRGDDEAEEVGGGDGEEEGVGGSGGS